MLLAPVVALALSAGTADKPRRDPLKWPFASTSIWNMPIGSKARYVPAGLSATPGNTRWASMPGIDAEHIVLRPHAPPTPIHHSSAGWSGRDRCAPAGAELAIVPMPPDYVVGSGTGNGAAAFLLADGRTIVQAQPLARCRAGQAATAMVRFANADLYGSGISGAHGGSGLSGIGGSIRVGELRPGADTGPRHALKVNVYAKEALYRCRTLRACYRWPASKADDYALERYGAASNNHNHAMKMGALLAIPRWRTIASLQLETAPGRQLAWTLQNYGAYIVDDSFAPGFDISVEDGPDGSVARQFRADWGFDLAQRVAQDTPWVHDVQKLVKALYVVDNNSSSRIGGGGVPLQPLAPPIAP